jgi:hypothetical protein
LIPPSTETIIVQDALIDETDIVPPFEVNTSVHSLLFKKCQFFDYAIESIIDTVAAYFPNVETLGLDVGDDDGNTNFLRLKYKSSPVNHKIKKLLIHLDNQDYYRYDFISFNPRQTHVNNLARLFPNVERLVLGRPFYDEYGGFDFSCFKNIKRTLCFSFSETRETREAQSQMHEGPEGPESREGPSQMHEGPESSEGPEGSEGSEGSEGPEGPEGLEGPEGHDTEKHQEKHRIINLSSFSEEFINVYDFF